jgi:threonine-phosphate decarboxylase
MIEGHGDDIYRYRDKICSNFSSNIFSHADLSGLKAHLNKRLDVIGNYPEPEPYTLEQMLAERLGISSRQIMVTNGATEAIYLIAQLFRDRIPEVYTPTFSEYESAIQMYQDPSSAKEDNSRIVWLCNPNNPDGKVVPKAELERQIKTDSSTIYVIDQSYANYTLEPLPLPHEMVQMSNCLLLHSMTKRYCIPGLRLGYVTAAEPLIEQLRRFRQPWSVNALAIEAGCYLLEHDIQIFPPLTEYLAETQRLRNALNEIEGVTVQETQTNFMLARLKKGTAAELKAFLIQHHGILIRDASNFTGLTVAHFRVATQTREENDRLIEAVKAYVYR